MHYKNGREAKDGDRVIVKDWQGKAHGGTIYQLQPGAETCNGVAVFLIPGGTQSVSVTVGDIYHIEDALAAVVTANETPPAAPAPAPDNAA